MKEQPTQTRPARISSLVVKVVERCNLNCSYCYMYNHADQSYLRRPALMSEEVFEQLLLRIREYCDNYSGHQMSLTLHGGEPMLMGVKRFEKFAAMAHERLGDRLEGLQMQSNATMVDDHWISALQRFQVRVGVSLDGPADIHDMFRLDHFGNGSHARTVEGLLRLQEAGVFSGALSVVNPAYSGPEIYQYFRSLNIGSINFLLPDATHDSKEALYARYGETPVADYLIPIFDTWYAEDDPDVNVKFFEDLIRVVLGGAVYSEALTNSPLNYVIIDTDGTIQANDALKVCSEGIPETGLNLFEHGFDDLHRGFPLLYRTVYEGIPLCSTCQQCHERATCGGGNIPHRYSRKNGFDNPSIWCKDLMKLLSHVREYVQVELCA